MGKLVVIDWKTAEYLACLIGQIPWGNQKRRASAAADLAAAMSKTPMDTSLECFKEPNREFAHWDIECTPHGGKKK